MKRLLILLIAISIAAIACGQEVLKRDLELRKTAPVLNLNGSGAVLQFYNGDVTLTQSSNLLTLSGGNLSLGANSLLGSGSIGATGTRLLKGWFTDLEITNLPTINGADFKTAMSLTASDVGLGNVTNESKATMFNNSSFTGSVRFNDGLYPGLTDPVRQIGTVGNEWNRFYLSTNGYITWNNSIFLMGDAGQISLSGGNLSLGSNNLLLTGNIGTSSSRANLIYADTLIANHANITLDGYAPINNPTFQTTIQVPAIWPTDSAAVSIGLYNNPFNTLYLSGNSGIWFGSSGSFTMSPYGTIISSPNIQFTGTIDSPVIIGSPTIRSALIPETEGGADLGNASYGWNAMYLDTTGVMIWGNSDILLGNALGNLRLENSAFIVDNNDIGLTGYRVRKGWFTDLEITNLPTVNGGTLASALSLSSYLLKSDTSAMLAPYALLSETGSSAAFDTTRIYVILDSLITVLSDTINIEELLQIDLDTDTIPSMDWVREYVASHGGGEGVTDSVNIETLLQIDLDADTLASRSWIRDYVASHEGGEGVTDSVSLAAVAPLLTDTKPWFIFGAGMGEANDSIAFAKGKRSFGSFNVVQDSLYVVSLDNILISANDSLRFNVYYGNRMTATPVDSLFTGPQSCGDNQTTFTPNNERTIPPGNDVWVGLMADQPTGYRPREWNLQLNAQIRRD